ncbi:MAG: glycerate kinase [Terricaulis sp.]
MRVLIACDSFKDALSAAAVCRAIRIGLQKSHPDLQAIELPLSDGGEGILAVLGGPLSLRIVEAEVRDPLGRLIRARYGLARDASLALVEMAEASGLQTLSDSERDPLRASSFGTGQVLAHARDQGARRIMLAVGGSATNDAGAGAAAAVGWQFLGAVGDEIEPNGANLTRIAALTPPREAWSVPIDVLCDVVNPLFGASGAARVYGRQKGADAAGLAQLDAGLQHIAALARDQLGLAGLAEIPGAGAAGGMGFGAMAFMGGVLRRGVETVLDLVGFDAVAKQVDLIITGEGRIDRQSRQGKLVQGVCARAEAARVPVVALCGQLSATPEQVTNIGLAGAYCINTTEGSLKNMLARTAENLERTAAALPLW